MTRLSVRRGVLAVLFAVTATAATAQEFRATVKGQVVDSSKAAVPGATVNVTNTDTNEVASAVTNHEGNYTVPFLRPGPYTLTVELTGFQKYTRTDMRLQVGETAVINVTLAVGQVTEAVTVTVESPVLENGKEARDPVMINRQIERDTMQL